MYCTVLALPKSNYGSNESSNNTSVSRRVFGLYIAPETCALSCKDLMILSRALQSLYTRRYDIMFYRLYSNMNLSEQEVDSVRDLFFYIHFNVHIPVFSVVVILVISLLISNVVIYCSVRKHVERRQKRNPAKRGERYVDVQVEPNGE